ncbi:hypothetical protein VTN49DRAFT_3575 [Thermomyces lanuginosus]|uniref:uncharacterized protein n=1 Tax=Thermomyces lanuginosus TaxID=5541 RepID=UPI0037428271
MLSFIYRLLDFASFFRFVVLSSQRPFSSVDARPSVLAIVEFSCIPCVRKNHHHGRAGAPSGNQRTAALQAQIDDTVGVMRENINKVSQRGERLDALQDKTDNLAVSAQGFRRGANRVRKQMWWKDMKMRICLVAVIIILIVVIVVPAGAYRDKEIISPASDSSARRHVLGPGVRFRCREVRCAATTFGQYLKSVLL